jgi:hypothetical protein
MSVAIRDGRSPEDGYRRGIDLEFGGMRESIRQNADFLHAFSYATDRTVVTTDRMMNLFLLLTEYLPKLPFGQIIEYGSYRAGSAFFMGALAKKFLPGCQVYALDTFMGMPETDADIDAHIAGQFKVDYDEVVRAKAGYGLDNVHLVRGLFNATAPAILRNAGKIVLAHIDCDIYESVRFSYEVSRDYMVPGGYFVFDDSTTPSCLGATEAVEKFVIQGDGLLSEQIWPHHVFRAPGLMPDYQHN